jgi:hypothetical protein
LERPRGPQHFAIQRRAATLQVFLVPQVRVPECPVTRVPECSVTRVPECSVTRVPECPVTRVPECSVTRVPECSVTQHKSLRIHVFPIEVLTLCCCNLHAKFSLVVLSGIARGMKACICREMQSSLCLCVARDICIMCWYASQVVCACAGASCIPNLFGCMRRWKLGEYPSSRMMSTLTIFSAPTILCPPYLYSLAATVPTPLQAAHPRKYRSNAIMSGRRLRPS